MITNLNSCTKVVQGLYATFNDSESYTKPTLKAGLLRLADVHGNSVAINYADILSGQVGYTRQARVAAVQQTGTMTINSVPSSSVPNVIAQYSVTVSFKDNCSSTVNRIYSVQESSTTAPTTTSVAADLFNQIKGDVIAPITVSGLSGAAFSWASATTGVPVSITVSTNITLATTQANVVPHGNYADLVAMGVTASFLGSTNNYTTVTLVYRTTLPYSEQAVRTGIMQTVYLFIEEGGTAITDILTGNDAINDMMIATTAHSLTLENYIGKS